MMTQGVLPFQYQEEQSSGGMTALAGLPTYLELAHMAGLYRSIARHVQLREGKQGWSDTQVITSLVLLNLAGGECVEDLRILEKDEGFSQLLCKMETYGMPGRHDAIIKIEDPNSTNKSVEIEVTLIIEPLPSIVFYNLQEVEVYRFGNVLSQIYDSLVPGAEGVTRKQILSQARLLANLTASGTETIPLIHHQN